MSGWNLHWVLGAVFLGASPVWAGPNDQAWSLLEACQDGDDDACRHAAALPGIPKRLAQAEARIAELKAQAAKAKADAIARGERLSDGDMIRDSVFGQLGSIRCFDFSQKGARNLTVRVQVKHGEGKAIRVVESPFSMSNNQPAPKPVKDAVGDCVRRSVAKMTFPMDVEGNADVPVVLGVTGF